MAKIEKEIKDLTSTDIEPAAGATGAAEPAEPAAAETPPPPISKLHARMQGMGKNWKDDEDFYNQADDYVGELESFREKSQKEQQELMAIIDREPELAMILTDMGAGAPFLVALARHIDPADLPLKAMILIMEPGPQTLNSVMRMPLTAKGIRRKLMPTCRQVQPR